MAGLWERVKPEGEDRISMHQLDSEMVLYANGTLTKAKVVSDFNARLTTPLTAAEQADLNAIATQLDNRSTTIAKVVYEQEVMAWSDRAEKGLATEAEWRAGLGIA